MQANYLDKLNDRQRQAVEFGAGAGLPPPLLIIAGAGSGKTNTMLDVVVLKDLLGKR